MTVKRTISSTTQSAFKILVGFFCVLFATVVFAGSFSAGRVPWQEVLLPGGVLGFLLWFAISRKTVQMDDRFLYISVLRHVNQIPLDQIASVTEAVGMRDRAVTIHFRSETPFGRTVTFTPTLVFGRRPHPIVAELSSHAAKDEK